MPGESRESQRAHVQRKKIEAHYFRSAKTRHPKTPGDSSQAFTANLQI